MAVALRLDGLDFAVGMQAAALRLAPARRVAARKAIDNDVGCDG